MSGLYNIICLQFLENEIRLFMEPIDYSSNNKVDGRGYRAHEYLNAARMSSYGHQFSLSMKSKGNSFLNVGSGNDLLSHLLSTQGKFVVNFDLNFSTSPSVCGKLPFLPFMTSCFDVILCFQMLEHLPMSFLPICLKEFARVGTRFVIISLPDVTYEGYERLKHISYKLFKHPKVWQKYQKTEIDVEHEWEIGLGDVKQETIEKTITANDLSLIREFRNDLHLYHHFYVCKINVK